MAISSNQGGSVYILNNRLKAFVCQQMSTPWASLNIRFYKVRHYDGAKLRWLNSVAMNYETFAQSPVWAWSR